LQRVAPPQGASYNVTWQTRGVLANVTVELLRHGEPVLRVASALLNIGSFQWSMPPDAPCGEGFALRVRASTNRRVGGQPSPRPVPPPPSH
jgi:hypothetical protein